MSATWASDLPNFTAGRISAVDAGLIAGAQVLLNAVRRKLRGGYTSGAFFTGVSMNSVTRSDPVTEDGVRVIRVGGKPMYLLYWELGHYNIFTSRKGLRDKVGGRFRLAARFNRKTKRRGKYERQERFRPALVESRTKIAEEFAATYKRFMAST